MGLIHWWPLVKDGNDCGYLQSNRTVSLTSGGKIGSNCMYNTSFWISADEASAFQPSHGKSISVTAWIKGGSSLNYFIACNAFEIRITPGASNGFHLGNGGTNTYGAYANKGTVPVNTWTHIGCIWDAGSKKIQFYVNGVLKASTAVASDIEFNNISAFNIPYQNAWYTNDVRIYDHALSQLEVSEIAKACVLHYDFEDPYMEPTINLSSLTVPNNFYVWGTCENLTNTEVEVATEPIPTNKYKHVTFDVTAMGVIYTTHKTSIRVNPSTQYTISVYIKTNCPFNANHLFIYRFNSSGTLLGGSGYAATTKRENLGSGWYRYYATFTTGTTTQVVQFSSYFYPNIGKGYYIDIAAPQFEWKDHITPYIYGSRPLNLFQNKNDYNNDWSIHQINAPIPTKAESGNITLYGSDSSESKKQSYTRSSTLNIKPNTKYKLTVWAKLSVGARFQIYFHEKTADGTYIKATTILYNTVSTEWTPYTVETTTTNNTYLTYIELHNYNGTAGSTVELMNHTLTVVEECDKLMCYDASGYGRDGEFVGEYSIKQDANRGHYYYDNISKNFTDSTKNGASYILTDLGTFNEMTAFTWSMWCKVINRSVSSGWYSFSNNGTDPIDYNSNGFCNRDNYLDLNTTSGYCGNLTATNLITDTNWHHYVITYNGSKYISYKDGEKINETSHSGIVKDFRYLWLGYNKAGGRIRQSRENWADVKLYATALTADQIKTEYQRKAAIGRNGSLVTSKLVENNYKMDTTNLVWNGCQELENNSGFSGAYDSTRKAIRWQDLNVTTEWIEINRNDTYELSFDIQIVSDPSSDCYFVVYTRDEDGKLITPADINHYTNTETTLATELKSGDTTVTLTSGANWYNENNTYRSLVGLYMNTAYGYKKSYGGILRYKSISGNTVTLLNTYTGATIPAGTKVAEAYDGGTYCYPKIWKISDITLGQWMHYSGTWTGNQFRYGTRYVQLGIIYSGGERYCKNIRLVNKSRLQLLQPSKALKLSSCADKNNCFNTYEINEVGMPVRYIRDSLKGNTYNPDNHWVEIEAFNSAEENILYGKKCTTTGNWQLTDEVVTTYPYISGGISDPNNPGYKYQQIDIGRITNIQYLKIWHYYADSRKYNNITQVSTDGTNWITVFDSNKEGQYTETSAGHTIYLNESNCRIYPSGVTTTTNLIEN